MPGVVVPGAGGCGTAPALLRRWRGLAAELGLPAWGGDFPGAPPRGGGAAGAGLGQGGECGAGRGRARAREDAARPGVRGRGSEAGPRGPGGGAVRASQVPGRRRGGSARPGELGRAGMLRAGASGACLPGDLVAKQKQ